MSVLDDAVPDAEGIERGRVLFAQQCDFVWASADAKGLPPAALPEIAFLGRSNVGKSSLVNALTGRNTLARTSNTPGRTRQLVFFNLGQRLMLVDMPGYGFAKVARSEVASWQRLIGAYLRGRATLRRLLLLIDARHGIKDSDREWMKEFDKSAVSFQIVLTKADAAKAGELAALLADVEAEAKTHVAAHPLVLATSAEDKRGIAELRAMLGALALPG